MPLRATIVATAAWAFVGPAFGQAPLVTAAAPISDLVASPSEAPQARPSTEKPWVATGSTPGSVASPPPAAPPEPPKGPPTVEELAKRVEGLGKHLTVTTADGDFRLVLGGTVVADALYSTSRPLAPGTPFFLFPDSPFGHDTRTFDLHARQTSLFALFTGPDVLGCKAGGMVLVNLYDNSVIEDRYGVLPILAFGELKSEEWRFAAGLQFDVFNPLNPTVLPFSLLSASGNAGVYRGQFRVERLLRPDADTLITLTGALSEPIPTLVNDELRISEDNGLPNLELRAAIGLGDVQGQGLEAHRPIEAGVSAVCGQFRTVQGPRRVVGDVWALGADARWAADPRWGVQGEAYVGQGLGTYGGSALQNINPDTFRPIRTGGFWVEGFCYWPLDGVHTHVGYGIDDPADADAGSTLPIRNETYYATTLWDVTKNFRVGFQVSYLKTAYRVLRDSDACVFHTQFMWKF